MAKQFGSVYFLCDPVLGADPIGAAADWPAREILMDRIHEIIVIDIVLRIRSYPFWAAAPKGTKSCRTQGDFRSFVRSYVRASPPSLRPLRPQIWPLGPQIWPLRPQIWPLRPQTRPLRPTIWPLRPQI